METCTLILRDGKRVLFDQADLGRVMGHRWRFHPPKYVITGRGDRQRLMHRIILGLTNEEICDHINGDGLDNRRCNLRVVTPAQNAWNAGPRNGRKYKGVFRRWIYRKTKEGYPVAYRTYFALIVVNGKRHELKWSQDPEVCARAYDEAARRLHGAYARLNFP